VLDPVVMVPATATGAELLTTLATRPARQYLVVDQGRLVGVVRGEALAEALTART